MRKSRGVPFFVHPYTVGGLAYVPTFNEYTTLLPAAQAVDQVEHSSRVDGVAEPAFIRDALWRRHREVLGKTLAEGLAEPGVTDDVASEGGYGKDPGRHSAEMMAARQKRREACRRSRPPVQLLPRHDQCID